LKVWIIILQYGIDHKYALTYIKCITKYQSFHKVVVMNSREIIIWEWYKALRMLKNNYFGKDFFINILISHLYYHQSQLY